MKPRRWGQGWFDCHACTGWRVQSPQPQLRTPVLRRGGLFIRSKGAERANGTHTQGNDKGHWFHQDMTFVTGKSREWIAQRVAVAIVNATYDAARAVAERCPRPDADAFPPIPPVFLGA